MFSRLMTLVFVLFAAGQAEACRYLPKTFDEYLAQSEKVFIGSVKTVENRLAVFEVEKGITGIKDGETFELEMGDTSCDTRFEAGQIWLYMGASHSSGTRLLMDDHGRILDDSAKLVKERFSYDVTASPAIIGGTLQNTCAPWDGAAFRVTLDNGVSVTVYEGFKDFDTTAYSYAINNSNERMGGGSIDICDSAGKNCNRHTGRIVFGAANADTAAGQVVIEYGEHTAKHVFRVKRSNDQQICG